MNREAVIEIADVVPRHVVDKMTVAFGGGRWVGRRTSIVVRVTLPANADSAVSMFPSHPFQIENVTVIDADPTSAMEGQPVNDVKILYVTVGDLIQVNFRPCDVCLVDRPIRVLLTNRSASVARVAVKLSGVEFVWKRGDES